MALSSVFHTPHVVEIRYQVTVAIFFNIAIYVQRMRMCTLVKYLESKWISQARILCACSARDDEYKIRASKFDYDGYDDFDKVKSKTGQETTIFEFGEEFGFRIRRIIKFSKSV